MALEERQLYCPECARNVLARRGLFEPFVCPVCGRRLTGGRLMGMLKAVVWLFAIGIGITLGIAFVERQAHFRW